MSKLIYQALDGTQAESLLPIWSDEEVIRYTNIKSPCSLDEVMDRISRLKKFDVFTVLRDGEVIGIIGCPCVDQESGQYGLFYQFRKSAWGQGNATEAVKWLLEFMQQKHPRATLLADVAVDNIASEKILKKYGFELISEETFERDETKMKVHNYRK